MKQGIALLVVFSGFLCGSCGGNRENRKTEDTNRDTGVVNQSPRDAAGVELGATPDADLGIDAANPYPQDAANASADAPPDANPEMDAANLSPPDVAGGRLTCEQHPTGGEACDPLPDGVFCRHESCTGGCLPECRCKQGRWSCEVRCRDYFSPIPIDCGTPPLCRETCQTATVLPDGGLVLADGNFTTGYRYQLRFSPADMTTLWGEQKLRVSIGSGPNLDTAWLQDLAAHLSIRTWPEMEEVASTSTLEPTPSATDIGVISIVPRGKLADRWYAVRLSAAPFWIAAPPNHVAPDGSYVVRFRTGSEPMVATVTFAGGPSKHRLYIALSEPVVAKQSPAGIVQVQDDAGAPAACTDVAFVAGQPMQTLSFDCPSITAFPNQVSIAAGLVSTTGAAMSPVTIAKTDLTLSGSCGEGCQVGSMP
jgi:hypothetical protein